jgi:hypothetical protein
MVNTDTVPKRSVRRPYKSMQQDKLITKRDALQTKLALLKTRVCTWNDKVEKYEYELQVRSADPTAQTVESSSSVEEAVSQ